MILDAQTFEDKLIDARSSLRGYVENGRADLLIKYRNDIDVDLQALNQLTGLTRDNPAQQEAGSVI